jgi:hypothetical protein
MNLIEYLNRQIPWSERTFGHSVRTVGITKHIEKELAEIEKLLVEAAGATAAAAAAAGPAASK